MTTANQQTTTEQQQQLPDNNGQRINIVVAAAENNAIGKNNRLLWHLPLDLKHFKQITTGQTILMGRKTYDSIGKPLPNRRNIIITRQPINLAGCEVAGSVEAALALCAEEKEVYIVGGAEIYRQMLPQTNRIFLTRVHKNFDGDTFFPSLHETDWKVTAQINHASDEKNPLPYSFQTLERY